MSSLRRIQASRANGARSRGPVTPQGKARSARNALRHGILARTVVLQDESSEAFQGALASYVQRFQPADDVELGFVEEMVTSFWRQRRCWGIETRILEDAISSAAAPDALGRFAEAFTALAASPQLGRLHRYEGRLHRMFQRALQNFLLLRQLDLPNEPNPISEHPPEPPAAPESAPAPAPEPPPAAPSPAPEPDPPPAAAAAPEPAPFRRLFVDIEPFRSLPLRTPGPAPIEGLDITQPPLHGLK